MMLIKNLEITLPLLCILVLLLVPIARTELSTNIIEYEKTIGRCEHDALRLGTEIADLFNAPIGGEDWDERIHQDKIIELLGFAPWLVNGIAGKNGKTLQGNSARDIFEKFGWGGKSVDASPYTILNHKWIYMLGDSTTRQIWASFAAPFQGNSFERNAKEWTRHYCNGQLNRKKHVKGGHYDEEGWRGPCGVNEVTCHVSGYGDKGVLSFDWKHFPYEDYDEWLWGPKGPWIVGFAGEGTRKPDVLTVQFGMHSCWHANPEGLYSKHLTGVNTTMIDQHLEQIPKLMRAIRQAVDHQVESIIPAENAASTRRPTMVIIVTSGGTGMDVGGVAIDACVSRFNRAATKAAHEMGFAVLDRGEIEHRLMVKSTLAPDPILKADMHLPQPGQNLVATCLMKLMSCLDQSAFKFNITSHSLAKRPPHEHRGVAAKPLHTPPTR